MARVRFYVTEQLGPKRATTPEGFLVCYDVPIARIGTMQYGPGETPVEVGPDGVAVIHRHADDVFADACLASFHGKPLTNDHPHQDVTPENWRDLAIGTVINPRKGAEGCIVADIIVTDVHGIALVNTGKVEVSCGYDADYEEVGPGEGRQRNIIGNHVALVERGRCGPRCSIGDSEMPTPTKSNGLSAFLMRAFKAKDAAELETIEQEAKDANIGELSEPSSAVHVYLGSDPKTEGTGPSTVDSEKWSAMDAKMGAMDAWCKGVDDTLASMKSSMDAMKSAMDAMKGDDPDEDDDEYVTDADMAEEVGSDDVKGAKDSARFLDSFRSVVSGVEIVSPGAAVKTFDAMAKPTATVKALHEMRLNALDAAAKAADTQAFVRDLNGGREFDRKTVSVRDARTLFTALTAFKRQINNAVHAPTLPTPVPAAGGEGRVTSVADWQRLISKKSWM